MTLRTSSVVSLVTLALAVPALAACGGAGGGAGESLGSTGSALTPTYGLDYSYSRPSISSSKDQGFKFVARYLSGGDSKDLTHAEADSLIAAGLDIVVVWEADGQAALNGYDQGADDARAAEKEAASCGQPSTRPIYFAVDFDAESDQMSAVSSYFDGVASVIGRSRTGAYGGMFTVQPLFDSGKISFGWQTYAWSDGEWDSRAQLRQIENDIDDGQADKDEAVAADYGQWGAVKAPPPPPKGVNGPDCSEYSPYDCRLGVQRQVARVVNDNYDNAWSLAHSSAGWPILDGNGNQVGTEYGRAATFNYGQSRSFDGELHVLAMSTSAGVAGWLPYKSLADWGSFKAHLGDVSAKDDGLKELGCYEVAGSVAADKESEFNAFEELKVVRYAPATESEEKVMNYTSYARGGPEHTVLANMVFNVTLVSPTIDVFQAGTKFQRLDVPTSDHIPSLDVDLWKWGRCDHDGKTEDSYCEKAGQLKFIYGRVITPAGGARYGWMALEGTDVSIVAPHGSPAIKSTRPVPTIAAALVPSSGCQSGACGALASCCSALPENLASTCNQTAPELAGDTSACELALGDFRNLGYCK